MNTVFELRPHQRRVHGDDHCPSPAGHTISGTSQDAIGLLGHLGTLLAHLAGMRNANCRTMVLLWFNTSRQLSTTQPLAHSPAPSGMGERTGEKKPSWVNIKTV